MALLCIMKWAWWASSHLIQLFRTQNFSMSPFLTCDKEVGKKWEFAHHILCFSHIHAGVRKYLALCSWKKLLFFPPLCFTLSLCKVSCANIVISQCVVPGVWTGQWQLGNQSPALRARILLHWVALPLEIWALYSCRFYPAAHWGGQCYRELSTNTEGVWVYDTLLLFIMKTTEVKWDTKQLYCLSLSKSESWELHKP